MNSAQRAGDHAAMRAGIAPEDPKLDAICVTKKSATAAPAPTAINRLVPPRRDRRRHTIAPMSAIAVYRTGKDVRPNQRIENRDVSRPARLV